jgi:hypothetical protein
LDTHGTKKTGFSQQRHSNIKQQAPDQKEFNAADHLGRQHFSLREGQK